VQGSFLVKPIASRKSKLHKQFAWMHAQRGCQFQDIQKRKIPFAAFDISRITWMDVRQFGQFGQRHSVLVAEFPNCLPKSDLFARVFGVHTRILDYDPRTNNRAQPRRAMWAMSVVPPRSSLGSSTSLGPGSARSANARQSECRLVHFALDRRRRAMNWRQAHVLRCSKGFCPSVMGYRN